MLIASVAQLLSPVWFFATPWTAARQASLSFIISQSLLKLMSIELVMPSNRLNLYCPLHRLPSIFPRIRVFSNDWLFSSRSQILELHLQSFQGISGLISYRIDWFDVFAAHGTLKSLLQNHNSKPLILQRSAFFMVQLSSLYLTPGKP